MKNLIVKIGDQRVECEAKVHITATMEAKAVAMFHHPKSIEPTQYMIKYNNRWRRVYAEMFCNHSMLFIKVKGEKILVEATY